MTSLVLLVWPLVAVILFARMALAPALIWATVVPYLFLPEGAGVRLSGLPNLDKTNTIALGLALGFAVFARSKPRDQGAPDLVPGSKLARWLVRGAIVTFILGLWMTVATNDNALTFGPTVVPGMKPWDFISLLGGFLLTLAPFWFAQKYLARPEDHRLLMQILVTMGVVYSAFMLIEIRFSPQLHNWVYGFHQHSFLQHVRGGYRPKVFLQHGLWVGFFAFTVTMAAVALWKVDKTRNWHWAAVWLFVILAISENLGALAVGLLCLGAFLMLAPRGQMIFAASIAVTMLVFPALRQAQMVPLDAVLSLAEQVSSERAGSLEYRLDNEDLLLERALEKPLFGWGSWNREKVWDLRLGKVDVISEGRWTQTLGVYGWVGYLSFFGLLTAPMILLVFTRRRKPVPPETVALALICAGNLIYMIPNSTLTPAGWLVFGALAGFVQHDSATRAVTDPTAEAKGRSGRQARYTRFPQRPGRRGGPEPA